MNRFGLLLLASLAGSSAFQGGASAQGTIPTTPTMTNAFSPNVEVRIGGELVKNDPVAFVKAEDCIDSDDPATEVDEGEKKFTFKLTSLPSNPINNLEV